MATKKKLPVDQFKRCDPLGRPYKWGNQVWLPVRVRKTHECTNCRKSLVSGTVAFKPVGGRDKHRRMCLDCLTHAHRAEMYLDFVREQRDPECHAAKEALKEMHRELDRLNAQKGAN